MFLIVLPFDSNQDLGGGMTRSGRTRVVSKNTILVLACALAVGGFVVGKSELQRLSEDRGPVEALNFEQANLDRSWVPAGYTKFRLNPFLAYKDIPYTNCSKVHCFPFKLIASRPCSKVYVQADIMREDLVLDWTSDMAYKVEPGEPVKLRMESDMPLPWRAKFTVVTCQP